MKYLLLFTGLAANILTNLGFKMSAINDAIPVKKWGYLAGGLVFGLINSILFTEALKYVKLGEASAIFFSCTIMGLYISSHYIFHEPVSTSGLVGAVFILTGVVIISLSMK